MSPCFVCPHFLRDGTTFPATLLLNCSFFWIVGREHSVVGQKHMVSPYAINMVVIRCRCEIVEAAKFNIKEQDNWICFLICLYCIYISCFTVWLQHPCQHFPAVWESCFYCKSCSKSTTCCGLITKWHDNCIKSWHCSKAEQKGWKSEQVIRESILPPCLWNACLICIFQKYLAFVYCIYRVTCLLGSKL